MRLSTTISALVAAVAMPALAANAASTQDSAYAARLNPLLGDWTCTDTGSAKPYTASVKREGPWIVWRDTGEDASTIYVRWNSSMHRYVVANIVAEGDVEVSTSTAADPLNGTWQVKFPESTSGPTFTLSYSDRNFSLARPYVLNGKPKTARLRCTKR